MVIQSIKEGRLVITAGAYCDDKRTENNEPVHIKAVYCNMKTSMVLNGAVHHLVGYCQRGNECP